MAERAPTNSQRALRTVDSASVAQINELEAEILEKVAIGGDLSQLNPRERMSYYLAMCRMANVSPVNRPFEYLMLDKKLTLYVSRRATDEIRKNNAVSIEIVDRQQIGSVYMVTAKASLPDGRQDIATGVVAIEKDEITGWEGNRPIKTGKMVPLNPTEMANAMMKAETKAKRRVTLSAIGLGMLDESEIETISGARPVPVNHETGELMDQAGVIVHTPRFSSADEVNRAAHAFIERAGGNHTDLHNLMTTLFRGKYQSLKDLPQEDYENLLAKIEEAHDRDAEAFAQWMTRLRASAEPAINPAATEDPPRRDETVVLDPEAEQATKVAEKRVLELARRFGWDKRTVDSYAISVMGVGLANLAANGLTQLHARLAATSADERTAFLTELNAPESIDKPGFLS